MCSHEIKRRLHLERKTMTKLDSISKSRNNTLPTKVHIVKAIVSPVVMYSCESWTIKKAEHQRIDAFELWCWRRLLRVPWIARRSNQSMLKEVNPEYSLEVLMVKLQIRWPPDVRSWRIRKDPDAGKDWRQEEKGKREDKMIGWLHQLKGHEFEQAPGDGEGQGSLAAASTGSQRVGHDWVTEQQILKYYWLSKVLKQLSFFPRGIQNASLSKWPWQKLQSLHIHPPAPLKWTHTLLYHPTFYG